MSLLDTSALDQDLDRLVFLFRLLSDKTRVNILLSLAKGERNVSSICEELKLPQPTVSHHLGLLRINNMIANRRKGKQVFYSLHGAVTLGDEGMLEIGGENLSVKISRKALMSHSPTMHSAVGHSAGNHLPGHVAPHPEKIAPSPQ
jgi:DNA-binding transcriptional ArsR family regulator